MLIQQRRVFKTFRSERNDPKIGRGMVDHDRHHALETQKQAHLNCNQNNGENDANDGRAEAQSILQARFRDARRKISDIVSWTLRYRPTMRGGKFRCAPTYWPSKADGVGALASNRRSAPTKSDPNGTERAATAIAQARVVAPAKTIAAFAIANHATVKSAYCSQTTNG